MTSGDHGLQLERTTLAWLRVGTAALVNAALLGRLGLHTASIGALAAAGAMLALSAAAAWWHRRRAGRSARHPAPGMPPARLMALVATLAALGGVAVLVALFHASSL